MVVPNASASADGANSPLLIPTSYSLRSESVHSTQRGLLLSSYSEVWLRRWRLVVPLGQSISLSKTSGDISILDIVNDEGQSIEVNASNGDGRLGGDDFDQKIVDWLANDFKEKEGIDLREDPMALQRLKDAAENAKKELSSSTRTEINC